MKALMFLDSHDNAHPCPMDAQTPFSDEWYFNNQFRNFFAWSFFAGKEDGGCGCLYLSRIIVILIFVINITKNHIKM